MSSSSVALRLRRTTLDDDMLRVRFGLRATADVPLSSIASIESVTKESDWKQPGILKVAVADEPRFVIRLRGPMTIQWIAGLRKTIDGIAILPDDDGFDKATSFARGEIDAGRALVVDFKYIGPQYPGGEAGHTLLLAGYIAEENLYILCNPAIPTPGLMLISAADLKHYWRSDHYGKLSHNVLSRPAIVVDSGR